MMKNFSKLSLTEARYGVSVRVVKSIQMNRLLKLLSESKFYCIIGLILLLAGQNETMAQGWTGINTPSVNQTLSYSYQRTAPFSSFTFTATSGTVVTQTLSADRTIAYVDIKWTIPGAGLITLKTGTTTVSTFSVSVSCGAMYAPSQITYRSSDQAASNTSCAGSSFKINATKGTNGLTVYWYHSLSDTEPFYTGDTYTTPALYGNTTYYISTLYYGGSASIEAVTPVAAQASRTSAITANASSSTHCESSRIAVPIIIAPVPTFSIAGYSSQICSGEAVVFEVSANTYVFNWTVDVSNVSGASAGSASDMDISQVLTNTTSTVGTATYTFRPYAYGCYGTPVTATVNVKPRPSASAIYQTICSNSTTSIALSNPNGIAGTTYSWSVNSVFNVNGASSGSGNQINQTLTNTSSADGTVSYNVIAIAQGCAGTAIPVAVVVKAPPAVTGIDQSISSGEQTSITLSNPYGTAGTTFTWTVNAPGVLGALSGGGSTIAQTLICPVGSGCSATYIVTPVANGCTGLSENIVVSVATSSYNENFIMTNTLTVHNITDVSVVETLSPFQRAQQIDYFDGTGRHSQTVNTQASPGQFDVVQPVGYDPLGRESRKYLPYRSSDMNGWYKINAITDQTDFYSTNTLIATDEKPFYEMIFEPSPLNRPVKQGAPGTMWQPNEDISSMDDHSIKHQYNLNQESEIYLFTYDEVTAAVGVGSSMFYESFTLKATQTYDEGNNIIIEYTDKSGHTVCKKVQSSKPAEALAFASTYYIYDDFGNLVLVLPPEGVEKLKTALNLN